MASTTSSVQTALATRALDVAIDALAEAVHLANEGRWGSAEQMYDAAKYLLEGQRILPNAQYATTESALIYWNDDADGFRPSAVVAAAVRGDKRALSATRSLVGPRTDPMPFGSLPRSR